MTTDTKRGTLTIAGSGIASIVHITLETLSYIKESDKLLYLVCDPVTEAFIQDNATGDYFDLSVFYDKNKSRYDPYIQMCEVCVNFGEDSSYYISSIYSKINLGTKI